MNKFRQHIPNFVDTDPAPDFDFETTQDLLALEVVRRYGQRKDFSHFAMHGNCLMEISDGGHYWWVVGYVEHLEAVDLPQWEGGKYRAELSDGSKAELTRHEVLESCGDILTLRNGTQAKWIR